MALLPCPFCGGKTLRLVSRAVDDNDQSLGVMHYIMCQRHVCMATGPTFVQTAESHHDYPKLARHAWNQRKLYDPH